MIQQGTQEWFQARLGLVTASRIVDVMMKPSTAGYQNYRSQLVVERLMGEPVESFKSAAMERGTELEPQARANYMLETGLAVQEVGFIPHATLKAGASPDGLVGDNGLVEIKCPMPTEHLRTLTGGAIQRKYALQMQFQMACTGREWCDFVSFNPDLPDHLALHIERVKADAETQLEIEAAVSVMCGDVEAMLAKLARREAA